jgi:aerobic C4-dicarboxylate transport protein
LHYARKPALQIVVAILLATALGLAAPDVAVQMKPLGDGFFRLLRMMIAPVIFTTVVVGLCTVGDLRTLGRLGARALLYFEVVSTAAMLLGVAMANLFQPGAGLHFTDPPSTDAVTQLAAAPHPSLAAMLLGMIPTTLPAAFVDGDILQVLLVSILIGVALAVTRAAAIVAIMRQAQQAVFAIVGGIMRLAPIGAFGALAAAIGAIGAGVLGHLAALVVLFYASVLLFIVVVLGGITSLMGLSLWRIIRLFRAELLIACSLASTEVVLPRLLTKLEQAGVRGDIAGFVLPAGYSFNADGTALYMAVALGFVAQATDHPLSLLQQLGFLAVMLLTSKGSSGMAGGSLVKLAATLRSSSALPMSGLGLLIGVERPIGSAVVVANVLGNVVATLVIAKWEGGFDEARFAARR